MTVNVTGTGGTATPSGYPKTVDLTIGSNGCTSSLASTFCVLTLTLPAGHYLATVTTYDRTGGTGNVLSAAQAVPFIVLTGHANTIPLTLGGYPASIVATPLTPGYLQSSIGGLKLYGASSQQLLVEARDADDNTIVGAGAPRIGATSGSPALLGATPPPANAPNTVTVQAIASGNPPVVTPGIVTLNLSATPPNDSGALAVNASVNVQILHSAVFYTDCAVSGCGSGTVGVAGFYDGNTTQVSLDESLTAVLSGLAVDGNGILWITTSPTNVTPYDLTPNAYGKYYTYPGSISMGLNGAGALAVDANDVLYVCNSNASLVEYQIGFTAPLRELAIGCSSLAVDEYETVYAAFGANVSAYPVGTSTSSESFAAFSTPEGVAIDGDGLLYVLTSSQGVFEYPQPGTTPNDVNLSDGYSHPSAIAVDAARTVYIANSTNGTNPNILVYPAGSTTASQPSTTISLGSGFVTAIAVVPRPL